MSNRSHQTAAATKPTRRSGRISRRIVAGVGALLVSTAAVTATATAATADNLPPAETQPVQISGVPLPQFDDGAADPAVGVLAPTVKGFSFDGSPVHYAPGTPTLLIFLAHWCPHCQRNVAVFTEWADSGQVPDGIDVISVASSTDPAQPNYPPSSWLAGAHWPFPVIADSDTFAAAAAFGLSQFSFFVLLDASGDVVMRAAGEIDPAILTNALTKLVTEAGSEKSTTFGHQ